MLTITIARKPISERNVAANVVRWGTGALNIDASRIAAGGEPRAAHHNTGKGVAMQGNVDESWGREYAPGERAAETTTKGRWPTNLILQHRPECELLGRVKVDSRSKGVRGGGGLVYGADERGLRKVTGVSVGYAAPDGTETVDAWRCVPGCPVVALDDQAGPRAVSGAARTGHRGTAEPAFGYGSDAPKGMGTLHNDSGGASRFFKQVQ